MNLNDKVPDDATTRLFKTSLGSNPFHDIVLVASLEVEQSKPLQIEVKDESLIWIN